MPIKFVFLIIGHEPTIPVQGLQVNTSARCTSISGPRVDQCGAIEMVYSTRADRSHPRPVVRPSPFAALFSALVFGLGLGLGLGLGHGGGGGLLAGGGRSLRCFSPPTPPTPPAGAALVKEDPGDRAQAPRALRRGDLLPDRRRRVLLPGLPRTQRQVCAAGAHENTAHGPPAADAARIISACGRTRDLTAFSTSARGPVV